MKFKKIICLILCFSMIFQIFIYDNKINATETLPLNDEYMKAIIATALVAGGLYFQSEQALNDTVEKVKLKIIEGGLNSTVPQPPGSPRPPRSWQDIITSFASVYLIYDAVNGCFKQVVDIGDDFFSWIKNWIDENFDVGDNSVQVHKGVTSSTIDNIIKSSVHYLTTDYGTAYVILKRYDVNGKIYWSGNSILTTKFETKNFNFENVISSDIDIYLIKAGDVLRFRIYSNNDTPTFYDANVVNGLFTPPDISQDTVIGTDNVVDNPNYDWNNATSGNKSIAFDVATDPLGQPLLDPNGLPVPNLTPDFMVGVQPGSVPQQNINGVPYVPPGTGTVTEPVAPPYPAELPNVEVDTPNKRSLLMKKFPFCLPYDLKNLFSLLNASAEAPKIEIDFLKDSGINSKIGVKGSTKFVYDMEKFPLVGQLSRFFSLISACLGLILATRRIMNS